MDYGILSMIPPVLTIVLAFVTRQVVLSLFIGAFSGALILSGGNPIHAFTNMGEEFINRCVGRFVPCGSHHLYNGAWGSCYFDDADGRFTSHCERSW